MCMVCVSGVIEMGLSVDLVWVGCLSTWEWHPRGLGRCDWWLGGGDL